MQYGGSIMVVSLFGDAPYETLMEDIKKIELVGDEIVEGMKTHHLVLHKEETNIALWIDAKNYLVRKVSIDMSKMIEKQKKLMSGLGKMKMTFAEIHNQIKIGEKIPRKIFVFKPPEGTKKTDYLFASFGGGSEVTALIGREAQDFTLEGLKEDTTIHLADYKGKVIVLDFWTTWCGPCRKEFPVLQKIYNKYKEKDFILIAINSREDRKTVQEFITKKGYTIPVALDTKGKIGKLYEVEAYPTLILIDKEGKIQKVHSGFAMGLKKKLEKDLNTLLAGRPLAEKKLEEPKELSGLERQWTIKEGIVGLAIGDLTGDKKDDLIAVQTGGKICIYNSSGEGFKCIKGPNHVQQIRLTDLNGDGQLEIIGFRTWGSSIFALKSNGETLWEFKKGDGIDDVVPIDVDRDGNQEIAVGFNGFTGLYLLDFDGKIRWKYTRIGNVWHVSGGDLNDDGSIEIVSTSSSGKVHIFDAEGKLLQNHNPGMYTNFVFVGEFISDSKGPEIITAGSTEDEEILVILNGHGKVLWKASLGEALSASPDQVACLSQKGWLAVGTRDGKIYIFDSKGKVIAHAQGLGRRVLVTWIKDKKEGYLLVAGSTNKGLSAYSFTGLKNSTTSAKR
ncbi:MAG: hypothetical protein DRG69_09320 [Deltaproteobacteria bacterium]|nr:MAG: hypothetical protein DRG69_09320 [Deltaproteobacteria bacterium]